MLAPLGCPSIAPLGYQASDPIFAPQLIGARLQSRGMMLHPWLIEVPCDPKWAQEWPVLENCPWPKLEQLVASLVATGILTSGKKTYFTFLFGLTWFNYIGNWTLGLLCLLEY